MPLKVSKCDIDLLQKVLYKIFAAITLFLGTLFFGGGSIGIYMIWHEYMWDMDNGTLAMVSILDSPAVDPRSNPGSDSAFLMSENLRLYTTSPVVIC